jgi:SAM-dependent methyltransferase
LLRHDWAIRRRERAVIEGSLRRYARGQLADVGCGRKPYRAVLAPLVDAHIGIDREDTPHGTANIDVFGSAYATTLEPESVDTVLMSQVFEHLEEPAAALAEALRILRPGGHLVLSTNFAWHLHEAPRDFYRYSPYGLRHLFERAGFEVAHLEPVAGTWLTVFEEIAYGLRRASIRHRVLIILALPLGHVCQLVGTSLDRLSFDDTLASGHLIVGRKV